MNSSANSKRKVSVREPKAIIKVKRGKGDREERGGAESKKPSSLKARALRLGNVFSWA